MMTDKHIGQWAGYLIEEFPKHKDMEKILREYPEFDEVFLEMYKKGYQDCHESSINSKPINAKPFP